jgi:hypothetical protein
MSAGFRAVQWNRAKLVYDGILLAGVVLYIGAYLTLAYWLDPPKDQPAAIDLRIRAFGLIVPDIGKAKEENSSCCFAGVSEMGPSYSPQGAAREGGGCRRSRFRPSIGTRFPDLGPYSCAR